MKLKFNLTQVALMMLGTFFTACATVIFFTPNKIVGGGVTGISTVLYHIVSMPVGLSYAVINIILLLVGIKVLGKEFIIKTVIGTALMSLFMELVQFVPVITNDGMLASIFGGIMYGLGLALTFISNASTGGTDILGRIIQHKFPAISIGNLLMLIDGVIILLSVAVFKQADLVLFGIIGVFIQSITIDFIIDRLNSANIVFVITDKGELVREYVRNTYDRGVTELQAFGYANKEMDKQLLICVLKPDEAAEFKENLQKVDKDSFVMFSEAKSILGKGFHYYK